MAFFPTLRRQHVELPYDVPGLSIGKFALYTPSHAVRRQAYPTAVQSSKDGAPKGRPVPSRRKLLGLLTGSVVVAEHYARNEGAAWLADMARGICCPQGEGGFLWVHDHSYDEWRRVRIGEPLGLMSYLYQPPPMGRVGLQTIYQRTGAAMSHGSESLLHLLAARDRHCCITRDPASLDAARILPKNMPLDEQQRVLAEFALPGDAAAPPLSSAEDARLALGLTRALEHYFERFWLGLRRTGTDAYECHSFVDKAGFGLTTSGAMGEFPFRSSDTLVHGIPVAPPQDPHWPPAALFRWHYLQCVLKKFGHDDYFNVPGIRVPAVAADDRSDIGRESEAELDWDTHMHRLQLKRHDSETF